MWCTCRLKDSRIRLHGAHIRTRKNLFFKRKDISSCFIPIVHPTCMICFSGLALPYAHQGICLVRVMPTIVHIKLILVCTQEERCLATILPHGSNGIRMEQLFSVFQLFQTVFHDVVNFEPPVCLWHWTQLQTLSRINQLAKLFSWSRGTIFHVMDLYFVFLHIHTGILMFSTSSRLAAARRSRTSIPFWWISVRHNLNNNTSGICMPVSWMEACVQVCKSGKGTRTSAGVLITSDRGKTWEGHALLSHSHTWLIENTVRVVLLVQQHIWMTTELLKMAVFLLTRASTMSWIHRSSWTNIRVWCSGPRDSLVIVKFLGLITR